MKIYRLFCTDFLIYTVELPWRYVAKTEVVDRLSEIAHDVAEDYPGLSVVQVREKLIDDLLSDFYSIDIETASPVEIVHVFGDDFSWLDNKEIAETVVCHMLDLLEGKL